ncbi:MAG TPA: aldehyde dehydrogenase family protein [Steroidobacteraceae bacterium]|jgi:acyl-CoA reductase-like NAD-dependent aldehyde dehydrogenase
MYKLLINGELIDGAGLLPVINPATGAVFAQAPRADAAQLHSAIGSAKAAFAKWSATSIADRRKALDAFCLRLEDREAEVVQLLTREQGKPLAQATGEVRGAILFLRYTLTLDLPLRQLSESATSTIFAQRSPLGVVAAITPWNFPFLLMMVKIAPALLAGNCVIAKPAATTPLTTLLMGEAAVNTLPPGVFTTIVDANDLGTILTTHPDIAKVSFTGSTATGRRVMASAADSLKRVTLELGGNDVAIVLDDANVAEVAPKIFGSAMLNSGQVCLATKRVYAHKSIYGALCTELARLAKAAVVGDGQDSSTEFGPVQNLQQFEKLKGYLEDAHASGTVIAGGSVLDRPGYFVAPTVVRDISNDSRLVREEQFGPILPVMAFENEDEVIALANDCEYGLGGTIWTQNPERGFKMALRIETGTLWINTFMELPPDVPIGGAKWSGIGLQQGQEGLEEYTQLKIIHVPRRQLEKGAA